MFIFTDGSGTFVIPEAGQRIFLLMLVDDLYGIHNQRIAAEPSSQRKLYRMRHNGRAVLAPQKQADGSVGWALPLDPDARCIHMGDISELGNIVAGAFAHPDQAGDGEYLPLVGDFMSFNDIVETLNRQGHEFSFKQVPKDLFATLFPGAAAIAETFSYFQAHTYLGSDSSDRIALANKIAGRQPTKFSTWARLNVPVQSP